MLKENAGEQERNDLLQELQVMKMLDPHPNVVRLLACCTERGMHSCYKMKSNDAREYIQHKRSKNRLEIVLLA